MGPQGLGSPTCPHCTLGQMGQSCPVVHLPPPFRSVLSGGLDFTAPGSCVPQHHLHPSRKTGRGCHSRTFVCPRGAGVALTSRSDSVEITRGQREGLGPRSALNSVTCWDLRADEPCRPAYVLRGSHGRSCPRPESRVRPVPGDFCLWGLQLLHSEALPPISGLVPWGPTLSGSPMVLRWGGGCGTGDLGDVTPRVLANPSSGRSEGGAAPTQSWVLIPGSPMVKHQLS